MWKPSQTLINMAKLLTVQKPNRFKDCTKLKFRYF